MPRERGRGEARGRAAAGGGGGCYVGSRCGLDPDAMKLIIKLPKRKEHPPLSDEVAKAEERMHQNALATTSKAALEGLDLASKVKSRKRKSSSKPVKSVEVGEELEAGAQAPKKQKKVKQKSAALKEKAGSLATHTKIRFQVARAAEKPRGVAAAESIENGGARVVLPAGGVGAGAAQKAPQKKKKGVSLKERIAIREKVKGVLAELEKMDTNEIFKYPVTEAIAPGYFSIVTEPICLLDIRAKLENNQYTAWEVFWGDCVLLFTNAMKYNPDESIFYQQAEQMLRSAARVVREASGGKVGGEHKSALLAMGRKGSGGSSPNGLSSAQHRRTESNFSAGGSVFSAGGEGQEQSRGAAAGDPTGVAQDGQPSALAAAGRIKYDSKNVVKFAMSRRATFSPPRADRAMGSLSLSRNAEGMPMMNGARHLMVRKLTKQQYVESVKTFCRGLPKKCSSYIFKVVANKVVPGIERMILEKKRKEMMEAKATVTAVATATVGTAPPAEGQKAKAEPPMVPKPEAPKPEVPKPPTLAPVKEDVR